MNKHKIKEAMDLFKNAKSGPRTMIVTLTEENIKVLGWDKDNLPEGLEFGDTVEIEVEGEI